MRELHGVADLRVHIRAQASIIAANYPKLQMIMGLVSPLITFSFPYLSQTYGVLHRLKTV